MQLICPNGQFTSSNENADCTKCTEGYFCYSSDYTVGPTTEETCPEGFYCPEETGWSESFPCPVGTYGPTVTNGSPGLISSEDCQPCPATRFCPRKGMKYSELYDGTGNLLTNDDYICKDGFVCDAGSSEEEGTSVCPEDSYCQAGEILKCPMGTYSLITGLVDKAECIECAPGKVCPNHPDVTGLENRVGIEDCVGGYYCPNDRTKPTETGPP